MNSSHSTSVSHHPAFDDVRDAELLRQTANGDRQAFQALHERYEGLLFSVIFRILNDRQDSEEVLQEVFFALWRKAGLFHAGRGRPVTWLTSMARNRAIDRLRLKQRKARLLDACEKENTVNPVAVSTMAVKGDEAAHRRDRCRIVREAVIKLTPPQREAIELAYFDGLTQKEIASRLCEPLGTVKARIRRGMNRLRHTIDRESA